MTGFSSKLSTEISGIGWAPVGFRDLFIAYGKTIQPCSKTSVERAFGSFVGAILGRMASVPRGELRATSMPLRPRRSGSPDWGVETRCLEVRRLADDNT